MIVLATAAQLLRQAGVSPTQSIWAEDGLIFLNGARTHPWWSSMSTTYAGYLHVLPRLFAESTVHLVPVSGYAAVIAVSAAAVVACLAVFVYDAMRDWVPSRGARALVAGFMVAAPSALTEGLANWANMQWPLAFACFWALVARSRGRGRGWIAGTLAVLAAVSAPLTLLFTPVALMVFVCASDKPQRARAVAFLTATAVQVTAILRTPQAPRQGELSLMMAQVFSHRVAAELVVGTRWYTPFYRRIGPWLPVLAAVIIIIPLVLLLARAGGARGSRGRVILLSSMAAVTWVLPYLSRRVPGPHAGEWVSGASRYALVPQLFILCAVTLAATELLRLRGSPTGTLAATAVVVWLTVAVVPSLRATNTRSSGPAWNAERSITPCSIDGTRRVRITPAPPPPTLPTWYVSLPCVVGRP